MTGPIDPQHLQAIRTVTHEALTGINDIVGLAGAVGATDSSTVSNVTGIAKFAMSAMENFWWTVGGIVVAATITGLGWFVYATSVSVATVSQSQIDMREELRGMHQDIRDIKNTLAYSSGSGQSNAQQENGNGNRRQ